VGVTVLVQAVSLLVNLELSHVQSNVTKVPGCGGNEDPEPKYGIEEGSVGPAHLAVGRCYSPAAIRLPETGISLVSCCEDAHGPPQTLMGGLWYKVQCCTFIEGYLLGLGFI